MDAPHRAPSPNSGAPPVLRWLLDGIDRLCRIDGWMAAVCLGLLTLLILAEIAVRFLSSFVSWVPADIPVAWEYSSYLMAATFTFGAAMTLRSGGHIRVTLVIARLPRPLRRVAEALVAAAGLFMAGFLTYAMARFTYGAFERGQTSISSDTRLWIPQLIVTFGILLLALQFLARLIQALLGLPLEDERLKVTSLSD